MDKLIRPVLITIIVSAFLALPALSFSEGAKGYVTSEACRECHEEIYIEWKKTPHARMLRNAFKDPDAVEATDFSADIPFKKNDIYFTVGSHWIQKYLTLLGGQFYVLPKYWNIPEAKWESYSIWNWREMPYPITCNGCHAVGFEPDTRSYTEESIGCEACHGPGGSHVESEGDPGKIVHPAKLSKKRRDMICEACHTDGKDRKTQTYPFPVGFKPGEDLTDYFTDFFMPKPKSKGWYWGDMSYKERHRMFMFWSNKFYASDRACDICGFDRGLTVTDIYTMSRSEYCGTCHREVYPRYKDHSFHTEEQAGCADCHVPTVINGGERYSIHDHRFDFSQPALACNECHDTDMNGQVAPKDSHSFNIREVKIKENLTVPQACLRCHEDKDSGWVSKELKKMAKKGFRVLPE